MLIAHAELSPHAAAAAAEAAPLNSSFKNMLFYLAVIIKWIG